MAARVASGPESFSPRPGDSLTVEPLPGDNEFRVEGVLDGVDVAGVAVTWRGGGLEYRPDEGMAPLDHGDGAYDTLVDVMGDADPSWAGS